MGLAKGREVRPCASAGSPRRPTTPSSVPTASTHWPRGSLGLGGPSLRSSPDEEGPSSLPQGKPFCDHSKRQGRVDPVQSQRKKSCPESSTPPANQVPFGLERFALKVELDVPASYGRSPPLALWQRQRAGTSRSTSRQTVLGTPRGEQGWPFGQAPLPFGLYSGQGQNRISQRSTPRTPLL